jgi:hypothetical protein
MPLQEKEGAFFIFVQFSEKVNELVFRWFNPQQITVQVSK